jgi:hypothetical protein
MLRFQFFLALSQQHRGVSVGRLAALAGYADQAHLTRESVELAALPPAQFLEETRSSCGANHDHSASFFRMQQMIAARR